jgi:ABC-type sugar transport system substrate-binding protein
MRHCRRCLLPLASLAVAVVLAACGGPKPEAPPPGGPGAKATYQVVVIDHPTVTSVQDRVRGFEQGLAKDPEFEIVDKPTGEGQRVKAMAAMENMLQKYPDLAGVFAINDDSALGALQAVRQAGRDEVVIIGYDATPEAREAILKGGPLKADVIQYPDVIGRVTADTVARYLAHMQVPKSVPIAVGIIDRADLEKGVTPQYPGKTDGQEAHFYGKTAKRLGVTLLTREHQFYRDLEAALKQEAERLGMTVVFQSADMRVDKQTNQVETFVTQGFDAIVICPADSDAIVGAVKTANKAGIPVFTADIRANGGEVVSHIASDNVQGGMKAAEYLIKAVKGEVRQ